MARIRLAPFMKALSGRMGGVVYRVTHVGTEMAEFEAPTNPRTSGQTAVRTAFKRVAQQWRNLTTAQAAQWRAYATTIHLNEEITTQAYKPSGFNAFIALGTKYLAVNTSQTTAPTTPPSTAFGGDTINVTATPSTGKITFTGSAANATNVITEFLIQRLPNANAHPNPTGYKVGSYFQFVTGTLSTNVTVAPGYYAVGYRFVNTATGQMSSPVYLGVVGPISFQMVSGGTNSKQSKAA